MHGTVTETDEYRTKHEKTGRRKSRSQTAKRKTNIDLSSPIFSKFISLHLNPLETRGPIIDLRKPSSAGENRHISGGLTVIKNSWVDNAYG